MGWQDAPIVSKGAAGAGTPAWARAPVVAGAAKPQPTPAPQNTDVLGSFVQRRPDGQLVVPKRTPTPAGAPAGPSVMGLPVDFKGVSDMAEDIARPVAGGVRNLVAGVVGVPADIAEALGGERSPLIDSLLKNLPVVEQNGVGGEIGQAVVQYAPLAMKAAGAIPFAAKNAPKYAKWATGLAKLGAASFADMLATDPDQASTIGDMLNLGPTNIQPGDNNLTKRFKVGAETPIAEGVVNLGRGIKNAVGTFSDINKARVNPVRQRDLAERLVMQSASDPEKAAADIAATRAQIDPNDAFKPTGPEASKDIGLLQLQRGVAQDPRMVARQQSNTEATIKTFDDATQRVSPDGSNREAIAAAARTDAQSQLAPVTEDLARSERRGAQIDRRIQMQAEELDAQRAAGPSASEKIAEADRAARSKVTAEKNRLYDPKTLDPENTLKGDPTPLLETADAIKPRPGQGADADIPSDIRAVLDELRGDNPNEMSFEYLSNLRTKVSGAIKAARQDGTKGGQIENLVKLKDAVNEEIAKFADQSAPLREADAYFKETASPILREGTGGKLTRAEASGTPVPDTEVAGKYLGRGAAPRERVADFNRMLAQVDDPKSVETAARDWLVSDLARSVDGKLTPERVERWMKNKDVAEILNGRPDVKKEVGQMLNRIRAKSGVQKKIEQEILSKTENVKRTQKEINESALGAFLDKSDPYEEVGRILQGSNSRQRMRQLVAAAQKDTTGEAMNGVKDAVKTWMRKKVLTSKAATGRTLESGAKKPSFGELDEIINTMNDGNVRGVLEDIYGPNSQELRNLDKVRKQLEITSRQERVAGTTNSSTKPIEENAKRTTTTLSAILAQNFRQNRILNLATSWLPDNSQEAVKQFMIEIILDPQMSETLMLRQTEENIPKTTETLRTYIANNIAGSGEDRRQKNQKNDSIPAGEGDK